MNPLRYRVLTVGPLTLRLHTRGLVTSLGTLAAIGVLAVLAMGLGDYPLGAAEVLRALAGRSTDSLAEFFVREMRLPRVLLAVLVGAALGTAGAIFQSVTRNPLGSPDVTGFTTGAASGALVAIIIFSAAPAAISAGALLGGFLTGAVVFVLARRDGINGMMFVLVGMGVSFSLQALNSLLMVKASLDTAQTAANWMAGSFSAAAWSDVGLTGAALVVLLPAAVALGASASVLESGDDLATGLGVPVTRRRTQLIALGVILVAVSVAAAGPITFIALAAPQIARLVSRAPAVPLVAAALVGAMLVLAADIIAQRLFAPTQLPVGVVTGCIGGVYLVGLLIWQWKKDRA